MNTVSYQQNELMSATDVAKRFGSVLSQLSKHLVKKIGVLKNNKLEAVIVPTEEYNRMQKALDILEHLELETMIKERRKTPRSEYVDFNTVLKRNNIKLGLGKK